MLKTIAIVRLAAHAVTSIATVLRLAASGSRTLPRRQAAHICPTANNDTAKPVKRAIPAICIFMRIFPYRVGPGELYTIYPAEPNVLLNRSGTVRNATHKPMMDIVCPSRTIIIMELWHALNHSIEGRDLFLDSQDYARFVHNLYEFNDSNPAGNAYRLFDPSGMRDFVSPSFREARELLVQIHGWVLMKDHYHLLLSELIEGGISLFLRKVNVGYSKYVNERYERRGTLFQSRTKKILISHQPHILYILHYIHLNPLDYLSDAENWRIRSRSGIHSFNEALKYLDSYRWSSYLDYVGKKNFPSILTTSLFRDALGNYHEALKGYVRDAEFAGAEARELILE